MEIWVNSLLHFLSLLMNNTGARFRKDNLRVSYCSAQRHCPCTSKSDLGGGVNGHDVNLRDKCGVCDDVTG